MICVVVVGLVVVCFCLGVGVRMAEVVLQLGQVCLTRGHRLHTQVRPACS